MPHPFVRAALTLPVAAAVLVVTAGPAAANDWTIKKPPMDDCVEVSVAVPVPTTGPTIVTVCTP